MHRWWCVNLITGGIAPNNVMHTGTGMTAGEITVIVIAVTIIVVAGMINYS
jgi:hypothetical protein